MLYPGDVTFDRAQMWHFLWNAHRQGQASYFLPPNHRFVGLEVVKIFYVGGSRDYITSNESDSAACRQAETRGGGSTESNGHGSL